MSRRSARVLIVEGHDETRVVLRKILEVEDFIVLEAADETAAFKLAVERKPDLILIDLSLQPADGLTTVQMIRSHESLARVPIIFVSRRGEREHLAEAIAAGCNECLIKPIDIGEMLSAINRCLTIPAGR